MILKFSAGSKSFGTYRHIRTYEEAELVLQAHTPKMMCMYVSLNTQSKFAAVRAVWYIVF